MYGGAAVGTGAMFGIGKVLQGMIFVGSTLQGVLNAVSSITSGLSLMKNITSISSTIGVGDALANNNMAVSNHVLHHTLSDGLNGGSNFHPSSSEENLGSLRTEPGNRKGIWITDLAKIGSDGFVLSVNYKGGMLTYEDGRSYVSGTSTYIDKVFHDLEELRNSDCDFLTDRLKVLENSEFENLIRYDSRYETEVDGWNIDGIGINTNARRNIPCGSKVNFNPYNLKDPSDKDGLLKVNHSSVFLAHELLGHSYDYQMGSLRWQIEKESGIKLSEIDAVNIENTARASLGERKRLTYNFIKIPKRLLWDTH